MFYKKMKLKMFNKDKKRNDIKVDANVKLSKQVIKNSSDIIILNSDEETNHSNNKQDSKFSDLNIKKAKIKNSKIANNRDSSINIEESEIEDSEIRNKHN